MYALICLARSNNKSEKYETAREKSLMALALENKMHGDKTYTIIEILSDLADTYKHLNMLSEAVETYEQLYNLQCEKMGNVAFATLHSLYELKLCYVALGEDAKEAEMHQKLAKALSYLHNRAYDYGSEGDHKKAVELYEEIYALRCKVLGEDHEHTQITMNNLAYEYGKIDEFQKSEELYRRLYDLRLKVKGEEHADSQSTLRNLAVLYWNFGKYAEAAKEYEKLHELYCRTLGEDHDKTITAKQKLTELQKLLSENA